MRGMSSCQITVVQPYDKYVGLVPPRKVASLIPFRRIDAVNLAIVYGSEVRRSGW